MINSIGRFPTPLSLLVFLSLTVPSAAASGTDAAPSDSVLLADSAGNVRAVPADTSLAAQAEIPTDPLLPEILSPGEKLLWGERGFMRAIGAFPLNEESREKELALRRGLLTAHQVGGFLTLASMMATAYAGQMIINGEGDWLDTKKILIRTTIAGYFTTAALALITPPPIVRRPGWSSVSTHKALAWVHFTGMIITPILGSRIDGDRDRQRLHQVSGYLTTAAFAGAMIVITF
jgi:hypothetical protein